MDNNAGVKRLGKVATEFNVGVSTLMEFLNKNGFPVDNPNAKIGEEAYVALLNAFHSDKTEKQESMKISLSTKKETAPVEEITPEKEVAPVKEVQKVEEVPVKKETPVVVPEVEPEVEPEREKPGLKIVGKVNPELLEDRGKKKKHKEEKPQVEKDAEPVQEPEQEVEIPQVEVIAETKMPEPPVEEDPKENIEEISKHTLPGLTVVGKIDLSDTGKKKGKNKQKKTEEPVVEIKTEETIPTQQPEEIVEKQITPIAEVTTPVEEKAVEEVPAEKDDRYIETKYEKLTGPKVVDKIDLTVFDKKPVVKDANKTGADNKPVLNKNKKQRPRIHKPAANQATPENKQQQNNNQDRNRQRPGKNKRNDVRPVISEVDIDKHIKETMAKLQGAATKSKSSRYRRLKRDAFQQQRMEELEEIEKGQSVLKVNEFITVSELAALMNVPATKVISSCMSLGLFVSLNQRLDAEAISIVALEFGFDVSFISLEDEQTVAEEDVDRPEDLLPRSPVVTVMGHVDHGKTSLLDNIRKSNIIAGESGGITQHIGAYNVKLENGRTITFLDTPGHEAFTAMRARGAKITDVAIIVIAADDQVMPQTIEAINHARAAGVPMVFAISKIDKAGANSEKIKEQLAGMNLLVEDWGGKYQSQEIDAKHGVNVDKLLEKVLLEADLLELTANPNKLATGTVIESSLDKGRGYTATILVHAGTLRIGDVILAGSYYGRVKAMFNERNQPVKEAGPSVPVLMLGLNGAPAAGDKLSSYKDEKSAKDIALKRQQLIREQSLRTQKHITLDEIGRRIAIGDFKELNIIVKGDVDGSVEALSDSLLKLSANSVQVNVIHKAIGGITESDVLLATASNAIIIGFQVRPSVAARKLAESEEIDIRTYSVIYDAIEEVKAAIEGMLEPKIEEKVVASVEVREVFKIAKIGTIAGCMVLDGKINRSSKIHLIRDGIVVHTGVLSSLKRFKDDVKEVLNGQDCGIGIQNFNDLKTGDIIEAYTEIEVQRKL